MKATSRVMLMAFFTATASSISKNLGFQISRSDGSMPQTGSVPECPFWLYMRGLTCFLLYLVSEASHVLV